MNYENNYDIIVSGGGLSGAAAAIAAAREDRKVLLIERYGFLGGMATAGLVNPFMGYEENRGIFEEILISLGDLGGLHENKRTFNEEIMKLALNRFMQKYGVDLLFHSYVTGVTTDNGSVKSITVANKSGVREYGAAYFIDATGDGDVSAMAGCKYEIGRSEDGFCQPMTLCFRLANVDKSKIDRNKMQKLYLEFKENGHIKNPRENILTFSHTVDDVMHFNTTRIIKKSPIDADDLTAAEIEAHEQVYEMYRFLKENVEGFENTQILMSATQTGVRESRRIMGEYKILAEDLLEARKFEDSIARGTYPVDIHNPSGTGTIIKHIPKGDYYTIPYRALVPLGMKNLIVCGRPISSSHEAHSAYRVMPICCCIGEAAGIAAALASAKNIKYADVDYKEIQALITKYGGLY